MTTLLSTAAGVITAAAICLVIARLLTRSGSLWHLGIKSRDEFLLPINPSEVLSASRRQGHQRGWRTIEENDETVRMQAGWNMATWARRIQVSTRQVPEGTWVSVSSISPQLYDWGDNRRTVASIRRVLERQHPPTE